MASAGHLNQSGGLAGQESGEHREECVPDCVAGHVAKEIGTFPFSSSMTVFFCMALGFGRWETGGDGEVGAERRAALGNSTQQGQAWWQNQEAQVDGFKILFGLID